MAKRSANETWLDERARYFGHPSRCPLPITVKTEG